MNTNLGLTLKTILLIRARRRRILQTRPKAVNYKNVDLRAGTKMQTNYNLQRQRSVLSREFSPLFLSAAIFCRLQKFSVEVLFRASAISRKTF